MVKARKYILAKHFDGFPKKEDFQIVEEELQPLKDGGKLRARVLELKNFPIRFIS